MDAKVQLAHDFARVAHDGQVRKYSDVSYYDAHLVPVAALVATVTDDPDIIAAAVLHDVLEDTATTADDLVVLFGHRVTDLVRMVTDVSVPSDGNRAIRKAKDRAHLALAHPDAKTIKLADVINNTTDIAAKDPKFAKSAYLREMQALLDVLAAGNATLFSQAFKVVQDASVDLGVQA